MRRIVPIILAAVAALAACGGGTMTDAQAKSEARSIYASSHLQPDVKQLQTDAGNNNFAALQSDARKMSADAKNARAAVQAQHWPANWHARTVKLEGTLAQVGQCMDAFASASGLAEMQAASQGKACQALSALSSSP